MWNTLSSTRTIGFGAALIITLFTARVLMRSRKNRRKITRIIDTLSGNTFAKPPAIGIDLGTVASRAAVLLDDRVVVISNKQGVNVLPSFVSYTEKEVLVGEAARAMVKANPANTISNAKMLLGRQGGDGYVKSCRSLLPFRLVEESDLVKIEVNLNNAPVSVPVEEIVSMLLVQLKETAEQSVGQSIAEAVITVPLHFNDSQRNALIKAGHLAGLNVLRIIQEPTAVLMAYACRLTSDEIEEDENVLVFHMGAGSCSAVIGTVKERTLVVKAGAFDPTLGGKDFDNCMVQFFVREFKARFNQDLAENKVAVQRLRIACERAKRILATSIIANIEINSILPETDFFFSLTKNEFDYITREMYLNLQKLLEFVLSEANITKLDVTRIILAGSATRIPKVQQLLSDFFEGKEFEKGIDREQAAVEGSAYLAAILNGDTELDKLPIVILNDVIPNSLGIETVGGIMTVLIARNTCLPIKKTQMFTTFQDGQTTVLVQVYEGEHGLAKENNLLAKFKLSGIPPLPRGVAQILVSFDVDVNGILSVSAIETSAGSNDKITITRNLGHSSKHHVHNEIHNIPSQSTNTKRAIETYLSKVKCTLEGLNESDGVPPDEQKKLLSECNRAIEWLGNNSKASKEKLSEKLALLEQHFNPFFDQLCSAKNKDQTDSNSNIENLEISVRSS